MVSNTHSNCLPVKGDALRLNFIERNKCAAVGCTMYRGFFSKKKTTFQSELKCVYYLYYLVYLLGVGSLGEDLFSRKNLTADNFGQD